jgi:putative ABC transport system permease protein
MLNFLFETFRLGVKNLRLHKLRSLLTALGIIFGVAAVIIMVAIGEGTKRAALEQIQQLGARNILVRSVRPPESTEVSAGTSSTLQYGLTRGDLERLQTLPDVETVVPLRDTEQKVIRGDIQAQANAIGTTPQIFSVVNLRLARGEYFTPLQYDRGESVCVIGHMAARQLFPFEDPLGEEVRVGISGRGTIVLKIIGVLEPTGLRAGSEGAEMMQRDLDMDVYFPLTLSRRVFGDTTTKYLAGSRERKTIEVSEVWLKTKHVEDVERLASIAENVVGLQQRNGRNASGGATRNDVQIKAPIQILRNAERLNRMFNFIMVGIASFSLVVGGIGIMNIMLASVTERTREIGIRRALGAKRRHITLQFLVETTVISLTGGLIGIALGSGGATLLPPVVAYFSGQNYPTAIAAWSVIGSFVVSGCIGIVFGLYPAIMAAWMNPIEALRHE